MLISLYRIRSGRGRDHRLIFDRNGIVIQRSTVVVAAREAVQPEEVAIGESTRPATDRLVFESVKNAVLRGYIVLYGYIPHPAYPTTRRYLRDFAGITLEPDRTVRLPIWPGGRRRRGDKPTYLLFTILSSVAK